MSDSRSRSDIRQRMVSWLPKGLIVLLIAAIAWVLAPRWRHDVVSVDGEYRWSESNAPPQRKFVWEPAEPVTVEVGGNAEGSLIHPCLTDGGATLYFTLRKPSGDADIFVSRLVDGSWQNAEPVVELNTDADDIGPVLANDGRTLYLYSNRAGGHGGFDIYASERTAGQWARPINLGPSINSPAHDQDPAVTPDGGRLFFSSNRTADMQERAGEDVRTDQQAWNATLRAQQGQRHFDLYSTHLSDGGDWNVAEPLAGVNRDDASDGEPFVSRSGVFLYFASNRPNESGDAINFDLYRARLEDGRIEDVESLGPGVNTAFNEHEPALSPEGFRVLFSSDRPAEPAETAELYTLYSSTATEIWEDAEWDYSHLLAIGRFLNEHWWVIVLCFLIVAFLAALIWYIRQVSLRRLPLPGFLLLALLFHTLLVGGLFVWKVGDEFVRELEKVYAEVVVAYNSHQSHEDGQESYEKVADLQSVETVQPTDVARQVTEAPNVTVPTESSIPSLPTKVAPSEVPVERITQDAPQSQPDQANPTLDRRQRIIEQMMEEKVEIERVAETRPRTEQQPAEQVQVTVDRKTAPTQVAANPLRRRSQTPQMQIARETIQAERSEQPVETSTDQPAIARNERPSPTLTETPLVTPEAVRPVETPQPERQPTRENVAVPRQSLAQANNTPELPRRTTRLPNALRPVQENIAAERNTRQPAETRTVPQPAIARNTPSPTQPADTPKVEAETLAAPMPQPKPESVARVDLNVTKKEVATPQANAPVLPRRSTAVAADLKATREVIRAEQAATSPAENNTDQQVALARTSPTQVAPAESAQVPTENLATPAAATPNRQVAKIDVALNRQQSESPSARAMTLPRRSSALEAALQAAREKVQVEKVADAVPVAQQPVGRPGDLRRTAPSTVTPTDTPQVEVEALAAAASPTTRPQVNGVTIQVERQDIGTPTSTPTGLPRRSRSLAAAMKAAVEEVQAERTSNQPTQSALNTVEPRQLSRSATDTARPIDPQIEVVPETMTAPSDSPAPSAVAQTNVNVVRSQVSPQPVADTMRVARAATPRAILRATQEAIESERVEQASFESSTNTATVNRLTKRILQVASDVSIEPIASGATPSPAGDPNADFQPDRPGVIVQRQSTSSPTGALSAAHPTVPRQMRVAVESADVGQRQTQSSAAPQTDNVDVQIARVFNPGNEGAIADATIANEQIGEAGDSMPSSTGVAASAVDVRIERRGKLAPALTSPSRLVRENRLLVSPDAVDPGENAAHAGAASMPAATRVSTSLAKASLIAREAAVEAIATEAIELSDPSSPGGEAAAMDVTLNRPASQHLSATVETASEIGGVFNSRRPNLVVGSLAKADVDAPPSFSPIASRISRLPARAPRLMYAEDNIGLQSMLRLRGADMETKKDLVKAFGGTDETLQAVKRGLTWLAAHQFEDGHWSLNKFNQCCRGHKCNGHGTENSDTAGTGLALLPFLGDGNTHQVGPYAAQVKKGIDWLVAQQKETGDLYVKGGGNAHMYSHGIATIALCECYGMSKDPKLKKHAQLAIDFIVAAQHSAGGWRYQPKQPGDTSVMGWQVMALKSGQMAGLNVPGQTLTRAKSWLISKVGNTGKKTGQFGYSDRNGKVAMTAEALLCLEYLGADRNDAQLTGGAKYLMSKLPKNGQDTSYYWYYGTQVMYHMQGEYWDQWNDSISEILIGTQNTTTHLSGTWDPKDNWEKSGGRIYSTVLRLLMLEVYYRHLPLYQALDR